VAARNTAVDTARLSFFLAGTKIGRCVMVAL
jgi:hypothetical protein